MKKILLLAVILIAFSVVASAFVNGGWKTETVSGMGDTNKPVNFLGGDTGCRTASFMITDLGDDDTGRYAYFDIPDGHRSAYFGAGSTVQKITTIDEPGNGGRHAYFGGGTGERGIDSDRTTLKFFSGSEDQPAPIANLQIIL
ncbi:MAG: hypothetical protein ABIJ74_03580 [archaeon]